MVLFVANTFLEYFFNSAFILQRMPQLCLCSTCYLFELVDALISSNILFDKDQCA